MNWRMTRKSRTRRRSKEFDVEIHRLASSISSKRHFVSKSGVFDPRYLVFEFSYGILLRKSQVELVNEFVSRGTMCHQMIMGAGKTTVVASCLLMSANEKTLVVEVVPSSLLFLLSLRDEIQVQCHRAQICVHTSVRSFHNSDEQSDDTN